MLQIIFRGTAVQSTSSNFFDPLMRYSTQDKSFFSHLVDVLGPDDFLAPVCMLLVEKTSNRVIRQNADEVKSAIALPISIVHHYSSTIQIFVGDVVFIFSVLVSNQNCRRCPRYYERANDLLPVLLARSRDSPHF